MNPFDLAMEMEKEGEKYYQHLAEKTASVGMKNILGQLALDERGIRPYEVGDGLCHSERPGA